MLEHYPDASTQRDRVDELEEVECVLREQRDDPDRHEDRFARAGEE
jgi:hypothetical protein